MKKLLLLCSLLALSLPASAAHRGGGGGGRVGVVYGPGWGSWGYNPWGPWGYGGYGYGYGYPGFGVAPNTGEIKLDTPVKDADVYINGAYAGLTKELKSMRLREGAYDLEVRAVGRTPFTTRVYVVNGRSMKIQPELRVQ